jgi:hypothetical protein
MLFRSIEKLVPQLFRSNIWIKFTKPAVKAGATVWPKTAADQERVGVRFDYAGEVEQEGVVYHKFQCQPNAGKIPSSIKQFRDKYGTHANIGSLLVKKDGNEEDVRSSMDEFMDSIK